MDAIYQSVLGQKKCALQKNEDKEENVIKIKRVEETVSELHGPDGKLIGKITSVLQLNDVRIQIKMQGLDGYYIVWKNYSIPIYSNGRLPNWPTGFYDEWDNQLMALID